MKNSPLIFDAKRYLSALFFVASFAVATLVCIQFAPSLVRFAFASTGAAKVSINGCVLSAYGNVTPLEWDRVTVYDVPKNE